MACVEDPVCVVLCWNFCVSIIFICLAGTFYKMKLVLHPKH